MLIPILNDIVYSYFKKNDFDYSEIKLKKLKNNHDLIIKDKIEEKKINYINFEKILQIKFFKNSDQILDYKNHQSKGNTKKDFIDCDLYKNSKFFNNNNM
jgi:hypothetical protein